MEALSYGIAACFDGSFVEGRVFSDWGLRTVIPSVVIIGVELVC